MNTYRMTCRILVDPLYQQSHRRETIPQKIPPPNQIWNNEPGPRSVLRMQETSNNPWHMTTPYGECTTSSPLRWLRQVSRLIVLLQHGSEIFSFGSIDLPWARLDGGCIGRTGDRLPWLCSGRSGYLDFKKNPFSPAKCARTVSDSVRACTVDAVRKPPAECSIETSLPRA